MFGGINEKFRGILEKAGGINQKFGRIILETRGIPKQIGGILQGLSSGRSIQIKVDAIHKIILYTTPITVLR
ncbi:hypothetical protein AM1BK_12840 [Neobacillus kokaensis]|uniref:Uncharacterized protein n=1 Tax=Neobacillus kokaensis TaxID=2759023 RepID=A0ABQ3N0U8_9BACI|nr:hypothetical protein AM1BK_12840 [Neobacillus kokaensis]